MIEASDFRGDSLRIKRTRTTPVTMQSLEVVRQEYLSTHAIPVLKMDPEKTLRPVPRSTQELRDRIGRRG